MTYRPFLFILAIGGAAIAAASCAATSSNRFGHGGAGNGGEGTGNQGEGGGPLFGTGGTGNTAACQGLQCQAGADNCAAQGKPPTTISGTVFDPAGKLPLYNVYVYIPNTKPDPILAGNPTCSQCQAPATGNPIIGAQTDAKGHFKIAQGSSDKWGVPSGDNLTLVLQVGKWRRQITMPHINACADNPLPDPGTGKAKQLRLPSKGSEGDMPLIAFTSGCDPAECFLRNIGIDDSEFVAPGNPAGHVHFYTGQDAASFDGNASKVAGGNDYTQTYAWWSKASNLKKYDIVFNACECSDYDRGGPPAYQAMHDYLEAGGRVFATHYYYNWFAPPTGVNDLQGVVNWALPEGFSTNPYTNFFIDTTFPKGKAFADWLQAQGVTSSYGEISLADTRYDMNTVTPEATRWIYNANSPSDAQYATMYMSFNSPINQPATMQCGRAVYSDVHLSGSSDDSQFPQECADADFDGSHAKNEQALEFLFFDLSSCVQDNSMAPPPPPQK